MLGDVIHSLLSGVGVTPDRVERWLGRPCGCAERREKLNQLTHLATRAARGKIAGARDYLERILGDRRDAEP